MSCTNRPSNFSLQLLEMPDLCRILKSTKHSDERITGIKDFGYNPNVLLGNWVENRREFLEEEYKHKTLYDTDYTRPQTRRDLTSLWNVRLKSQGLPLLMLREHGLLGEYVHNMATVYDLAYRCKARDFLDGNYGNVTGYGLKEMKSHIWDRQRASMRQMYLTEYTGNFAKYGDDIYSAKKKLVVPRKMGFEEVKQL
uniref:Uncharacterized protein n=1 Tax=Clastoptera arizonana TaxID=38151 RepID=A0A1B6C9C0_9HEMI